VNTHSRFESQGSKPLFFKSLLHGALFVWKFWKLVIRGFQCLKYKSDIRLSEFGLNKPLGITRDYKVKKNFFHPKIQKDICLFEYKTQMILKCQKPKKMISLRYGYYLGTNEIRLEYSINIVFQACKGGENYSERQKQKNLSFIRFGYCLCGNDIQWRNVANMIF